MNKSPEELADQCADKLLDVLSVYGANPRVTITSIVLSTLTESRRELENRLRESELNSEIIQRGNVLAMEGIARQAEKAELERDQLNQLKQELENTCRLDADKTG